MRLTGFDRDGEFCSVALPQCCWTVQSPAILDDNKRLLGQAELKRIIICKLTSGAGHQVARHMLKTDDQQSLRCQ